MNRYKTAHFLFILSRQNIERLFEFTNIEKRCREGDFIFKTEKKKVIHQ